MATTLFTTNYSGDYGKYYEFKAEAWEEKADNYVSTNQTTVFVNIYLRRINASSNGAWNSSGTGWSITIDGSTTIGTKAWDTRNTSDWQWLGSASKIITHNTDGSKTITISASHTGNSASGASKMGNASGNANFVLTIIPRKSTISATNADIGSVSNIFIDYNSDSFTHTLKYSFGSLSATIVENVQQTKSYPFKVPVSFYDQIPNAKSGIVTLTCITYNGNTEIGTSQATFKATASQDECTPDVEATILDINDDTKELTLDPQKLIKYRSTAQVKVTATAKHGATIKSITVNGQTITNNVITFENIEKDSFAIVATDSRTAPDGVGYSKTITKVAGTDFTMIDYIPLTLAAKFYRTAATSSTIKVEYSGNYFNKSFSSSKANSLKITWKWRLKGNTDWNDGGELTPTITDNKYNGTSSLGTFYDYKNQYDFLIVAKDELTTLNFQDIVKKGEPIYDWGVDGNGNNYLNVNGYLMNGQGSSVITLSGGKGTTGYMHAARLTITNSYANQPIIFEVVQRNSTGQIFLQFLNVSGTDPTIKEFSKTDTVNAYMHKYEPGVFDLYIQKTEGYDSIEITELKNGAYAQQRIKIEWQNLTVSELPEGYTTATVRQINGYSLSSFQLIPTVLFDNLSGTAGTITLSQSAANFNYLEIFYGKGGETLQSVKVFSPNGKGAILLTGYVENDNFVQLQIPKILINGTSITKGTSGLINFTDSTLHIYISDEVQLYKVLGYK